MSPAATQPVNLPPPEQIRELAHTIISRPEYRLDEKRVDYTPLLRRILDAIEEFFAPITDGLNSLIAASPVIGYTVVVLLIMLVVVLIYHIMYTLVATLRGPKRAKRPSEEIEIIIDPGDWETRAKEAAARGDMIGAIRYLFRAGVLRIEIARERNFRRGVTNHEILRAVSESALAGPVEMLVRTIDYKWYGGADCSPADLEQCSEAYETIRSQTEGGRHVPRA